jgi:hypothetical protein
MAGLPSMTNLARVARVVALLLFLLPWASVSCTTYGLDRLADGAATSAPSRAMPMARASGLQLATGSVSYSDTALISSSMDEISKLFERPNPAVAGAALLILLSLGVSFVLRGTRATIVGIIADALAAIALCYAVLIEIPGKADGLFHRLGGGRMGIEIHVNVEIGFWLCVAALAASILFGAVALTRGAGPPATASMGA